MAAPSWSLAKIDGGSRDVTRPVVMRQRNTGDDCVADESSKPIHTRAQRDDTGSTQPLRTGDRHRCR